MEKQIEVNKNLVAFCGLYCGACRKHLKGDCPGCMKNEKAGWCKIRTCCMEKKYHSCADCAMDVGQCKKFSNFISKVFTIVFRSDRKACIERIRKIGLENYAEEMAEKRCQTIKKK